MPWQRWKAQDPCQLLDDDKNDSEGDSEPGSDSEVGKTEAEDDALEYNYQSEEEKGDPAGNTNQEKHGENEVNQQNNSTAVPTPTIVEGANETTMTGESQKTKRLLEKHF